MGAHHLDSRPSQANSRRYRDPALEHQGQLDRLRLLQWQGGEDCITPITVVEAVAHRWRVAKTEPERSGGLHDIFLRSQTGDENSSRLASLNDRGHGMVAPKGFLHQYDQW